jgi:hypothetical protein
MSSLPPHGSALNGNVAEVDRLRKIHSQITTRGPGRKHNVAVLHKSGIVLLVACWEAFVEDLASAALEIMIAKATDHTIFPQNVLERVASTHQGLKAWNLAGSGWKKSLRDNMKSVLAKTTGALNTPKTAQIDELFTRTIGLHDLAAHWKWKGRSAKQASKALDDLVTLRGSIAHRVATARTVSLNNVGDARNLIFRIAVRSHNRVNQYLAERCGSAPWASTFFGGTK